MRSPDPAAHGPRTTVLVLVAVAVTLASLLLVRSCQSPTSEQRELIRQGLEREGRPPAAR